jgi:hypothetical protein
MVKQHLLETSEWTKVVADALAALNGGDMNTACQHLESLIATKAGDPKVWRKTRILAEDASASLKAEDVKRARHCLEALLAVTTTK